MGFDSTGAPVPSEKFLLRVGERVQRATVVDARTEVRIPNHHEGIVDRRNYNAAIEFVSRAMAQLRRGDAEYARGSLAAAKEYLGKSFAEAPTPKEF